MFYYYIRDLEKRRRIEVKYIGIEDMVTDGLIKLLSGPAFDKNVSLLGLRKPWSFSRQQESVRGGVLRYHPDSI